jgi:hypothetical protein
VYQRQWPGIENSEATFQSAFLTQGVREQPSLVGVWVMSSAKKKSDKELVSVEIDVLKERLNKLYQSRRGQGHHLSLKGAPASANEGLFEYLWDLKEKALLDRRSKVEVPYNWLDQLEQEQSHKRH